MEKGAHHLHGRVHRAFHNPSASERLNSRIIHLDKKRRFNLPFALGIVLFLAWLLLFGNYVITGNIVADVVASGADVFVMIGILVACIIYVLANSKNTISLHSGH
ncbi:MAG: hypothetical protein WCK90_04540 [archaeon]